MGTGTGGVFFNCFKKMIFKMLLKAKLVVR